MLMLRQQSIYIIVFLLIGHIVTPCDHTGINNVHFLAQWDASSLIRIRLQMDGHVNERNTHGETPLHVAVTHDSLEAAKMLLEYGANVNAQDNAGQTPLHKAALYDRYRQAALLFDRHALMHIHDHRCNIPLHYASAYGSHAMLQHMMDNTDIIDATNAEGTTPLHVALIYKNDQHIKELLLRGGNPNIPVAFLSTQPSPLHVAIMQGCTRIAHVLIEHKADPNIPDGKGKTALHYAIMFQYSRCFIRQLLFQGADREKSNMHGHRPLHYAVYYGQLETVIELLQHKAALNVIDEDGRTPLHYACMLSNMYDEQDIYMQLVCVLLARGADLSIRDASQCNVYNITQSQPRTLHRLFHYTLPRLLQHPEEGITLDPRLAHFFSICLAYKGDTHQTHIFIRKALGHAKTKQHYHTLHIRIIEHAAQLEREGRTGSMHGVYQHANPQAADDEGNTLLHRIARFPETSHIIDILLAKGCHVNSRNSHGETPLHKAVQTGDPDLVEKLILSGACVHAENRHGVSPITYAQQYRPRTPHIRRQENTFFILEIMQCIDTAQWRHLFSRIPRVITRPYYITLALSQYGNQNQTGEHLIHHYIRPYLHMPSMQHAYARAIEQAIKLHTRGPHKLYKLLSEVYRCDMPYVQQHLNLNTQSALFRAYQKINNTRSRNIVAHQSYYR